MSEPVKPCPFCRSSANVKDVGVGVTCLTCMAKALLAKYEEVNAALVEALDGCTTRMAMDDMPRCYETMKLAEEALASAAALRGEKGEKEESL